MKRFLTFFVTLCLAPTVAFGQVPPNIPGFGGQAGSGVGGEFDTYFNEIIDNELVSSPADPSSEFQGFTQTDNLTMPIATIHLNQANPCTGGICVPNPLEGQIAAGSRKVPLAAMLPGSLEAQSDYLWSPDAAAMSQANLNSTQSVWDVSMFLAESAVAQGFHNAWMKSATMNQNGFLETIAFTNMAKETQGAKPLFEAWSWCMQSQLAAGQGLAKARMFCSRDKGEGNLLGRTAVGVTPGFSFLNTPALIPSGNPAEQLLTDILFREEAFTSLNPTQLLDVKSSFADLYGDIKFEVSLDPTGTTSFNGSYRVINPLVSPSDNYLAITIFKFNGLREIIRSHCEAVNASNAAESSRDILERGTTSPTVDVNELRAISIPGFTMTAGAVTALRAWYIDLFRNVNNNSFFASDINCAPVENSGLYQVDTDFTQFNIAMATLEGREFFIALYHFARLLALGEWLTKAAVAEQVVESLSANVNQGEVYSSMAKDLIYKITGTKDIRAELERVSESLRRQFVNIYDRADAAAAAAAQKGSNLVK